jgi:hypothetical protein
VPAAHEERLLEILDRPDGTSIADGLVSYFAAATRGSLVTTGGESFDLDAPPQEKRWCAEPVPALGDPTPEQAAADPTRREQAIRLIDSYGPDGGVADDGVVTMRPVRLRELPGIGVD